MNEIISYPKEEVTIYTIVHNPKAGEFFVTKCHSRFGLSDDWFTCTFGLPVTVEPRQELPDGIVDTLEKYKLIFHKDEKEIPHPKPELDELGLNKLVEEMLKLPSTDRLKLLSIIMRHVIDTGEVEASTLRTTLRQIEGI